MWTLTGVELQKRRGGLVEPPVVFEPEDGEALEGLSGVETNQVFEAVADRDRLILSALERVHEVEAQRAMLLEILSLVPAAALADALNEAGYDQDVVVPLLRDAGADLSVYLAE